MSGPTLESVLAAHVRGDWSDHTYSCGGCRSRFEESTREAWVTGTEEERMAIREELGRHIKPDWTLADYNAHVAAAVAVEIAESSTGVEWRWLGPQARGTATKRATTALTAVRAALGEGVTGRGTHATGAETGAEGSGGVPGHLGERQDGSGER